jgi:TPR repeat protein
VPITFCRFPRKNPYEVPAKKPIWRASERPLLYGGTEGSNLLSSSGESIANLIFGCHPPAYTGFGVLYYYGRGVKRDYGEAMRWYRKAADQGDAFAQNNVGWLYANGLGVPAT